MVSEKLHIVQVLPELEEGGVEGETLDLAIYLAKKGHNSVVISGGGRMVSQLEKAGCRHIYWPHIGEKSFRCLKYIGKLRKYFQNEAVHIVHLRSRLPAWTGYLAWKTLPAHLRPSLVTTFHGFYSVNAYSTIMTRGERVVAVSNTIKEHILKHYRTDPQKISLIYGGFDVDQFAPERVAQERIDSLRQQWGIEDNHDPVIILPGRLTQWKGQDLFIDSLAATDDLPFLALCIGDTDDNPTFTRKLQDKIDSYKLRGRVKLVGHCDDMPAAMLLGDVIVSASSQQPEAFGKVAIEAMAMARPIIATAHGGSLETVRDNETGWLVEPANQKDMARAITLAIKSPELRKKYGLQGRKWVSEHFTAEVMCEKTLALYRELLLEKSRAAVPERLTILQMLPDLDGGGVERGTLEMGKYLSDQGHRSLVISGGGRLVGQLEKEGSTHLPMKVGLKSPIALRYIWPVRKVMQNEKVDILHLRSRMPAWLGYIAWKSLPARKRPVLITTFHGFYSVNAYSAIMTKGDAIIAVSKSIKQHIHERYGKSRGVLLIFRGVDGEVFNPDLVMKERIEKLRTRWQLNVDRPTIMLPGRLTRLKGQDVFLRSLLLIRDIDFQAVLVGDIAGNQGYAEELQTFIRDHHLDDRVHLVGHCTDMPAAYLLADLVVSASSTEPEAFGRTTAEAMAMGKPVIATAHGGSLETVVDNSTGWLVTPADSGEMAKILKQSLALDATTLAEIGQNGRERVTERFTTKAMCEKTLAVYRTSILGRKY